MSEKVIYKILVTDHTKIEWLASRFIRECQNRFDRTTFGKGIRWINPPKWATEHYVNLNFFSYELKKQCLNLHSFPSGIGRDFWLADLDVSFDGTLMIVDLGAKRFWNNQINREKSDDVVQAQFPKSKALMIRDPHTEHHMTAKEIDTTFVHRTSAFSDPRRIWGVDLVNQIKGAKLILAVKSSLDCVPASYIKEYLHLESPIDVLEHTVNPNMWSGLNQSYSGEIIRDTLSMLSQKVHKR